jgi:hypothetical protein
MRNQEKENFGKKFISLPCQVWMVRYHSQLHKSGRANLGHLSGIRMGILPKILFAKNARPKVGRSGTT